MHSRVTPVLVALLVSLVACMEDKAPKPAVPFEEMFTSEQQVLLSVPPDDPLGAPGDVTLWHDRVAVSDIFARNVKLFAADGRWLGALGQVGDGPGEFRHPSSLGVTDGDLLAVLDELHGAITYFDLSGEVVGGLRFPGAFTRGMDVLDRGRRFVVATRLVDAEGTVSNTKVAHILRSDGTVDASFGEQPVPRSYSETPFMGAHVAVMDDSLAVWGTVGRNELHVHRLDAPGGSPSPIDVIVIPGVVVPEWEDAPHDSEALFEWATHRDLMVGIIPGPGMVLAKFMTGSARRGQARFRYALVSVRDRTTVAVTEPSEQDIHRMVGDEAIGVTISDIGEAFLTRYMLVKGFVQPD